MTPRGPNPRKDDKGERNTPKPVPVLEELNREKERAVVAWGKVQKQSRRLESNMKAAEETVHRVENTVKGIEAEVGKSKRRHRSADVALRKTKS